MNQIYYATASIPYKKALNVHRSMNEKGEKWKELTDSIAHCIAKDLCSRTRIVVRLLCYSCISLQKQLITLTDNLRKTVLL